MEAGLRFEIIYKDVHLVEVRVSAYNGLFDGVADVYVGLGDLEETAETLRGFPSNLSDVREVTFGGFGPKSGGGAVSMRFYCSDGVGHTYLDSKIESDHDSAGKAQSAFMTLAFEPAALDSFVEDLRRLGVEKAGQAYLKGFASHPSY